MTTSLRERKKEQSRAAIVAAAVNLFKSKGYSNTTLNDIAEEANISQRTIFSYFPSKEAIIFESEQKVTDSLFKHLENRGSLSVLESLKTFTVPKHLSAETKRKRALIKSNPELQNYAAKSLADIEQKFCELVAEDENLPKDSVQVVLIAAVFRTMIDYVLSHPNDERAGEVALKFIESGIKSSRQP